MNKLLVNEQMMKRAISFLLIAAFYVAGWCQEFSIGGKGNMMTFRISGNNEVSVVPTKDKYTSASCEIPAVVEWQGNQYLVTRIAEKAFYKSKMSGVTIPNTVKNIDALAFGLCRNLVNVTFQEGLERIGISAFEGAPISRVIIPTTVRSIGNYAFFSLNASLGQGTKLKTLSIPNTNIEIGEHAFNKFRNLYGSWWTSQCEVLSLPDWVTAEQAKTFGIHEDSYNNYIARKSEGTLPVSGVATTGQTVVGVAPTVTAQTAQSTSALKVPVSLSQSVVTTSASGQTVVGVVPTVTAQTTQPTSALHPPVSQSQTVVSASLSDVDQNIPHTSSTNENTFAIIIANEKYDREAEVQFACNDGRTFKRYCEETLGIPVENIHYRENATLNNMIAEVDWLKKVCTVFGGEAKVIFYYAGHGIPDEASKDAYLLPVDGIGSNVITGYKLSNLYETLGLMKTQNITVFLDACFSGSQRDDKFLVSARGVSIKTKPATPKGAMVVMTAAQSDETAYPYKEKGHGLFTYFLLKKLQDSKGDCTMQELSDYVKQEVSKRAIIVNEKPQTPAISYSATLGDKWKNMKLK